MPVMTVQMQLRIYQQRVFRVVDRVENEGRKWCFSNGVSVNVRVLPSRVQLHDGQPAATEYGPPISTE